MADFTKNPAGRLYTLTRKAKEVARGVSPPARFWGEVFEVPYSDVGDPILPIVNRLTSFVQLIDHVEVGFNKLELEGFYFEPFEPLRRVVDSSLRVLAGGATDLFDPVSLEHVAYLRVGAVEWSKRGLEPEVDESQLDEIRKQVDALITDVRAAKIPDDIRRLILSLLATILGAIDQYDFIGFPALETGAVELIGTVHWNSAVIEKAGTDSRAKQWLKKAGAIVGMFIATVTFAEKGWKALDTVASVTQFLTSGEPEIPAVDIDSEPPQK